MRIRRLVTSGLAIALALLMQTGVAVAATKAAPAGKVDLNKATVEQLTTLPGIGQAIAARIVQHREKEGAFGSVEELMNVRGIGEKSFEKLRPYVTVGGSTSAPKR
jgi:competence protein ComEA